MTTPWHCLNRGRQLESPLTSLIKSISSRGEEKLSISGGLLRMVTGRIRLALWLSVFLVTFCLGVDVYPADEKPERASNRLSIFSNMPKTRLTGIPGVMRPSKERRRRTSQSSFLSGMRPATGAM